MKKYFFIVLIVFLISSCEKGDVKPDIQQLGFLGNYLKNNPAISILKTTESNIVFNGGMATHRGYIFKPLAALKLKSFGGRIADQGIFKFEIFKLEEGGFFKVDTVLTDSININNVSSYQYKNINKEILLLKNERYLIRYFNENHNSVYDAGLGYLQNDTVNFIKFPLFIDDIEIEVPYYAYHTKYNGAYWLSQEGTFSNGILRGLIDFNYEIVK